MRTLFAIAAVSLVAAGGAAAQDATTDDATNAHDFSFHAQATSLYRADGQPWSGPTFEEGQEVKLSDYSGHPILVVNTAAHCGFTPQFEGLQAVWEEYRDDGLVVIGVHENDFGAQGGSEAELAEQCDLYAVDFPQMRMEQTVGPESHPFYAWVRSQMTVDELAALRQAWARPGTEVDLNEDSLRAAGFPTWNFNKVLISGEGDILATLPAGAFDDRSNVQPELIEAIESALGNT
jgi:glutathione peroxidase